MIDAFELRDAARESSEIVGGEEEEDPGLQFGGEGEQGGGEGESGRAVGKGVESFVHRFQLRKVSAH